MTPGLAPQVNENFMPIVLHTNIYAKWEKQSLVLWLIVTSPSVQTTNRYERGLVRQSEV